MKRAQIRKLSLFRCSVSLCGFDRKLYCGVRVAYFGPLTGRWAAVNILGRFVGRAFFGAVAAVISMTFANAETQVVPSSPDGAERSAIAMDGATDHRVMLYEEDFTTRGREYAGRVRWRTEAGSGGQGAMDQAIRADIDIPDRKLRVQLTIQRNSESALPASHVIEIKFQAEPNLASAGISSVRGMLAKLGNDDRGTPLAGLPAKIGESTFLICLSNVEPDRTRNLQLLQERSWFDVAIVYTNKRRAILAVEKGATGDLVFATVFNAWGSEIPQQGSSRGSRGCSGQASLQRIGSEFAALHTTMLSRFAARVMPV